MQKLNATELEKRLNELADNGIKEGYYCGIAGRVLQNGETVTEVIKGVADLDTKQPVTADTMFRLASMTKPITASAVLAAQDRGLLTVYDEVRKYLPDFGEMWVGRKETRRRNRSCRSCGKSKKAAAYTSPSEPRQRHRFGRSR